MGSFKRIQKVVKKKYVLAVLGTFMALFLIGKGFFDFFGNSFLPTQEGAVFSGYGWPVLYYAEGANKAAVFYNEPSLYGNVAVFEDVKNKTRYLAVEGSMQTAWDVSSNTTSPHLHEIARLLGTQYINRMALIGMGGGAFLYQLDGKNIRLDVAEINPKVVEASRMYFDSPQNLNYKVTIDDGRHFLRAQEARYDAIMVDICDITTASVHLFTREFYDLVIKKLDTKHGLFITTFYGFNEEGKQNVPSMVANTLLEQFSYVYILSGREVVQGGKFNIVTLVASNRQIQEEIYNEFSLVKWDKQDNSPIITDETSAQVVLLHTGVVEYVRNALKEEFGRSFLLEN